MKIHLGSRALGELLFHFLLFDITLFSKRSLALGSGRQSHVLGTACRIPTSVRRLLLPLPRARTQRGEASCLGDRRSSKRWQQREVTPVKVLPLHPEEQGRIPSKCPLFFPPSLSFRAEINPWMIPTPETELQGLLTRGRAGKLDCHLTEF